MATKEEGVQRDTWWLNELESLGVSPKVQNEFNDIQETSNLAENLKQAFIRPTKRHIMIVLDIEQSFTRLYFITSSRSHS